MASLRRLLSDFNDCFTELKVDELKIDKLDVLGEGSEGIVVFF